MASESVIPASSADGSTGPTSAALLSPLVRQLRPLLLSEAAGFTGAQLAAAIGATTQLDSARTADVARSLVRNEAVHLANVDSPMGRESERFTEKDSTPYVMFTAVRMGVRMPRAILTEFAKCYSVSCTKDDACYAPTCPNKTPKPRTVFVPSVVVESPEATTVATERRLSDASGPGSPPTVRHEGLGAANALAVHASSDGSSSPATERRNSDAASPVAGRAPSMSKASPVDGEPPAAPKEEAKKKEARGGWSGTIGAELVGTISKEEQQRQEVIYELVETEEDYLHDMELVKSATCIGSAQLFADQVVKNNEIFADDARKQEFVAIVFRRINDIIPIHAKLAAALRARQAQAPLVDHILDVLDDAMADMEVYTGHCPMQSLANQALEKEIKTNAAFRAFYETQLRDPKMRKLPLTSFLGRTLTRLGKYPILIEAIHKSTRKARGGTDNPDLHDGNKALEVHKAIMSKVNAATGIVETRLKVQNYSDQLINKDQFTDLRLDDPTRCIHYSGVLKRRATGEDVHVTLMDHVIILARPKKGKDNEDVLEMIREPLAYDQVDAMEEWVAASLLASQETFVGRTGTVRASVAPTAPQGAEPAEAGGPRGTVTGIMPQMDKTFSIVILGRRPERIDFKCLSVKEKEQWVEAFQTHVAKNRADAAVFSHREIVTVPATNNAATLQDVRVLCCAPFDVWWTAEDPVDHKTKYLIGTEEGMYYGEPTGAGPMSLKKVLNKERVMEILVLPDIRLIVILAEKTKSVFTLSFSILAEQALKEVPIMVKDAHNVTLIRLGRCMDRTFIAVAKIKNDITACNLRLLEPPKVATTKDQHDRLHLDSRHKFLIGPEASCLTFLQKNIIVGSTLGFRVLNPEKATIIDINVDATEVKWKSLMGYDTDRKACALIRVGDEYLLCFKGFGVFISKDGKPSRETMIEWFGSPKSFAYKEPYVLAFSEHFYEVRHVDTGAIISLVPGFNLCHLSTVEEPGSKSDILIATTATLNDVAQRIEKLEKIPDKGAVVNNIRGRTLSVMSHQRRAVSPGHVVADGYA